MSRLSLLDLAFFLTESEQSPKHVAGLMIFKKPANSSARWVHNLAEELAKHDKPVPPFNQVIDFRALGGPRWRTAENFAIEDHLFYHNPDTALSERELFAYCAGLHEPLMDRSKPMWEYHIIDRVAGDRFAVLAPHFERSGMGARAMAMTQRLHLGKHCRRRFPARLEPETSPVWQPPSQSAAQVLSFGCG